MANVDEAGTRRRRFRLRRPSAAAVRPAALALLAGAALNLAFAPVGWWPLAPLAVAAFCGLVDVSAARSVSMRGGGRATGGPGRRGMLIGFWFGTGFCWVMFQWLRVFGPGAQEAVGIVESLYFIPFGWGMARVSVMRFAPLWQACLWVTEEFGRSRWPFGGFSWGRLAFSQPDSPFTPLAAVGGAPLVTFAVALSGALLWRAVAVLWRHRAADARWSRIKWSRIKWSGIKRSGIKRSEIKWSGMKGVTALLAGAVVIPALGYAVPLQSPDSGTPVRIALIQGNVPRAGFGREQQEAAVLDNHVKETEVLAADIRSGRAVKPDLVVWPENGSDMDPYSDPGVAAQIQQAVDDVGVPVLVGAVIDADAAGTNVLNRLIVWTPDPGGGMGATYDKTHLVPFGEYLPFRGVLTKMIKRFSMIPRDFVPGHGKGVLTLGGVTVAAAICFEVAYDDVVRHAVTGGGQVLLVPSNNASYMGTGQTYQQLAIARLRAVEHGRWTMEAATSGVSAVIDPTGRILAQTGEYQARYLDLRVRRNTAITLADRLGAWPEYALALLGLLAAIGTGGAATSLRRTRALIPRREASAGTLPGAPDGAAAPDGPAAPRSVPAGADLPPVQTAAKGRAR